MDLETKPFVKALSVDLVNSWLNISLDEKLATKVRWFNGKSFSLPTKSAKSRACVLACLVCLRARVLDVLACSRAWRAYVLGVLVCTCFAYVLPMMRAWRVYH